MSYIKVIDTAKKSKYDQGSAVALIRRTRKNLSVEHYLVSCFHLFGLLARDIKQPCQQATIEHGGKVIAHYNDCLLYTSPSPRDRG